MQKHICMGYFNEQEGIGDFWRHRRPWSEKKTQVWTHCGHAAVISSGGLVPVPRRAKKRRYTRNAYTGIGTSYSDHGILMNWPRFSLRPSCHEMWIQL